MASVYPTPGLDIVVPNATVKLNLIPLPLPPIPVILV